ncbi:MAG: hypothetical protein ACREGD_01110 [Candidatus Saccharimonadales bacterium]
MQTASLVAGASTDVLRSMAEQLKVPLTTIARQAELGQALGGAAPKDLDAMQVQAAAALNLVDCYLLGLALAQGQKNLELEPVSLASALTGLAHKLYYLARDSQVDIEVRVDGRYGPVMANQRGLQAALSSLGYDMVEAAAAQSPGKARRFLICAVHRTPHGLVAGIYTRDSEVEAGHWRRALGLRPKAAQPLTSLSAGSSAGMFVADTILQSMSTRLRVGRHKKAIGLAATFQPSKQLAFV